MSAAVPSQPIDNRTTNAAMPPTTSCHATSLKERLAKDPALAARFNQVEEERRSAVRARLERVETAELLTREDLTITVNARAECAVS